MTYFDYHAKVKKLIKEGKLKSYYFDKSYNNIGFALVLCFDGKKYPIREERFLEYFDLIGSLYNIKKTDDMFVTEFKI